MRRLQKIVKNGGSVHVSLAPQMLCYLGWLPGEAVIVELTEQKSIVVRRPHPDEFMPKHTHAVTIDGSLPLAQ